MFYFLYFSLNAPLFYNFRGSVPELARFQGILDSKQVNRAKESFVKNKQGKIWIFKEQLRLRCVFQTRVLAKSCLKFLKEMIEFQEALIKLLNKDRDRIIFPYHFDVLTLSSFSYKMFRSFYLNQEEIFAVMNEVSSMFTTVSRGEFELASYLEYKYPDHRFHHGFSNVFYQKRFGPYFVDIYDETTTKVIQYLGCEVHLHRLPDCLGKNAQKFTQTGLSLYNKPLAQIEAEDEKFVSVLRNEFGVHRIKKMYECQWRNIKKTSPEYKQFQKENELYLKRPLYRLTPRIGVRGGFVEVYNLEWSKAKYPNETFKISDVNGLYAYIAMTHEFPVKNFEIIIGKELKHVHFCKVSQVLKYKETPLESGMVHASILAPSDELFPFLQYRVKNKFNFISLCKTCSVQNSVKCQHTSNQSRQFTSVWTLAEVNYALSLNYTVIQLYEIHFFAEKKPILAEFVKFFSSLRLKSADSLLHMTEDEKNTYAQEINEKLSLPPELQVSVLDLKPNKLKQQTFKTSLNALFGKFSQMPNTATSEIVSSQRRLEEIANEFEITDWYNLTPFLVQVEYSKPVLKPSLKYNLYIGAEINAKGRIFLHQKLKLLLANGAKIFYCDTDAIAYSLKSDQIDPLEFGPFPGQFKSVIESGKKVVNFNALGNKNYTLLCKDSLDQLETITKCKGLSLSSCHLENQLSREIYESSIQDHFKKEVKSIHCLQVRHTTKKGTLEKSKRIVDYEFRNNLYMRRFIKPDCAHTFPYGFKFPNSKR